MNWQNAIDNEFRPLLSKARIGLIADMDGTLSPIVNQPEKAQITPRNRNLLAALQNALAVVAVVSGRAAQDVQARVGLPNLIYIGNHGFEIWRDGQAVAMLPEADQYRTALEALRDEITLADGMQLEDKGWTLSIHYRRTNAPERIAAQYRPQLTALAEQHNLRLYEGRMVFEIRPPLEVHKGTALEFLVQHYHLEAALYLGDDTTDVDAMLAAKRLRARGACEALALGVVADESPPEVRENADLLLHGVQDVEIFLNWLLQTVRASRT